MASHPGAVAAFRYIEYCACTWSGMYVYQYDARNILSTLQNEVRRMKILQPMDADVVAALPDMVAAAIAEFDAHVAPALAYIADSYLSPQDVDYPELLVKIGHFAASCRVRRENRLRGQRPYMPPMPFTLSYGSPEWPR